MELTECSETLPHKIEMPGNHLYETQQHSEHGKSLKSESSYMTNTLPIILWPEKVSKQ